jgi:CRP/FNR family nitrogen fixation transcriptional regulator
MSAAYIIEPSVIAPEFRHRPERGPVERDPLGVEGVRISFARDEEIFGEEEAAECVYRVVSGVVRTYKILSDGRRQVSEFCLPGDLFGVETGTEHTLSAEAVCDAVVFAMRRRPLMSAAQSDGEIARKLWSVALHDLRRSQDHMLLLGRKSALERVVWFLMDMAKRIPAETELNLPVSRQDMADYLGLTIETVSRTMTQLQEQGLIGLRDCRHVILRDRAELELIAAA